MPVPQESRVFVEQAGKPVADNGATSQLNLTILGLTQSLYIVFCSVNPP
jgi:hypothetical protein